ncbi:DUF916 domain-containing protein [Streptomyces sp. NPDC086023]|uniref:DUF916 domain-containing protein n=1 Tax=Streptomyces sp. NPDC086023 TaxID=3365746 RepID=UPI0037D7C504
MTGASRTVRLLAASALALLGLLAPGAAGPASAADNGQWSVVPAAGRIAQRPYFFLAADPGGRVDDRVTVTNRTAAPLTFRLYAADAYNTARDGGFAVRGADEPRTGVGAWTRLSRERVTVPPRSAVTVPFSLTLPDRAEPGDHPGAIVALDERTVPGGRGLGVRQAVAARVHLRVSGPTEPALAVEGLGVRQDGDTAEVSYTLRNLGNVTLHPRARLVARGVLSGRLVDRRITALPADLLPGQSVRLTERWTGLPWFDRVRLRVAAGDRAAADLATTSFQAGRWGLAPVVPAFALLGGVLWYRFRRPRTRTGRRSRPDRGEWLA